MSCSVIGACFCSVQPARTLGPGTWLGIVLLMAGCPRYSDAAFSQESSGAGAEPAATRPVGSRLDSLPLSGSNTTQRPLQKGQQGASAGSSLDIWRLFGATAAVLGLIYAIRWFARRMMGLPARSSGSPLVRILSRSALTPKAQLLLLQVGRRIVLVADTGAQMNSLCEICDPGEVAELAGQAEQTRAQSATRTFLGLLSQAGRDYKPAPGEQGTASSDQKTEDPALADARREICSLTEKVRVLVRCFRQVPGQ